MIEQSWPRRPALVFGAGLTRLINHRAFVPLCLGAAIVLRLAWVALVTPQPVSDFRWYYERASELTSGQGYSVTAATYWPEYMIPPVLLSPASGRAPTAFWPVGYPAFLALIFTATGPSLLAAKLANVALSAGVLLLSYRIAARLFASRLVAGGTLLLLSFYPDHIAYSSLLSAEILFLFLLLLGVALLLTRPGAGSMLAAGVVFGLACLVKPQAIALPALCLLALRWHPPRQKFGGRHAILLYLALGLTLLPWLIRNYRAFDQFVFIANNAGYNLYLGNNPQATGGYSLTQAMIDQFSAIPGEAERNRQAQALALAYMQSHPLETLALWPAKLWYLYGKDIRGVFWNEYGLNLTDHGRRWFAALKIGAQLYYAGVLVAGGLALLNLWRARRQTPIPLLGLWLCLYFTLIHLLTFGESRFHFPLMPWLMMFAATLLLKFSREIDYESRPQ